jgi:hypothetical protein
LSPLQIGDMWLECAMANLSHFRLYKRGASTNTRCSRLDIYLMMIANYNMNLTLTCT